MIKVNYDKDTGRVIAFNKNIAPYIEITEEERRQRLPDKYSFYAVRDGKFVIERREPTETETSRDLIAAKQKRLKEIDDWFKENDWKVNKLFLGEWKVSDGRWVEYLSKRAAMRKEHEELSGKEVR